ncbi:MAG: hypothetical protein KatS3mg105_3213 [Gemmatales bacterium]|nr:MAG: hypothetical protein KatS3mg105_3213 [Gemmatales bacterium]
MKIRILLTWFLVIPPISDASEPKDFPKSADKRLVVEKFASEPDIVHPIGADFDKRGRLLVIESHTHFPPTGYPGPKHDRVRIIEDTNGDGKADRFRTFFEGTKMTMDIAVHADGSVYLATRNEILRLEDTDGDGKADAKKRIVFLDTKGNYPHNGLSGLAFDAAGDLYFGLGENLGAAYKLHGSDGSVIADEGEGGNVFWCTKEGKKLRRVATGFWNPFGVCIDIFGRIIAVDNDPDAMPPCRMLYVVEGGDFGYQFRYGRSGRHPFQSWNGQLYDTLPMMAGVGEGPCEVISYEYAGLPDEYQGDFLVASWAEHRIERYSVKSDGAGLKATRLPFVQGGNDFRPVGIAVAPDGSLFVTDWVLRDYKLHGRGAIWHIRPRVAKRIERSNDPRETLFHPDRRIREQAARKLWQQGEAGREFLRQQLTHRRDRVRAVCLATLLAHGDRKCDWEKIAKNDPSNALRALAVGGLIQRGDDVVDFVTNNQPAEVRRAALAGLDANKPTDRQTLFALLADKDPYLRQAALHRLAQFPDVLAKLDAASLKHPQQRMGLLLACRANHATNQLAKFLADPDPEVRFLAVKWIADEKLQAYRPALVQALNDPRLNVPHYLAYATALGRIDGRKVSQREMHDFFFARLTDAKSTPAVRLMALRALPADYKKLTPAHLGKMLQADEPELRLEAVRVLCEHPSKQKFSLLKRIVDDNDMPLVLRLQAVAGLSERAEDYVADLLKLAEGDHRPLREEALRALVQTKLTGEQKKRLEKLEPADFVARVLGKPFTGNRPAADQIDAWLGLLEGPADAEAGRRIFFHPKLANCARCHRIDGRGADIGPDLSTIGRMGRRHLLESILQPGNQVAPYYQVWALTTIAGKSYTGLLYRTYLDEQTYIDPQGKQFKVNAKEIEAREALPTSLMPDKLADQLTIQELRDLLRFLEERK